MGSDSQRAHNKKSLLSVGVLILSLAALQSPLWRVRQAIPRVAVRSGGATLIASDRPIAQIAVDRSQMASAEIVGEKDVLVRGKATGETRLILVAKDGHTTTYRVLVTSESAQSFWGSLR